MKTIIDNDTIDSAPNLSELIHDEQLTKSVNSFYNCYIKRIIDFFIALFGIVLLLPLGVVISIAIILDTGFPIFYRAPRGGYKNKTFKIYKFRSMIQNADKVGGHTTALHDKRITKVGYILRNTKLDEIPQLINILKGEMSFVGPRPEVLDYVKKFIGKEKYILQARPGITDYSSLKFANMDATVGDGDVDTYFVNYILAQKNELRVRYISEISFVTDVKIFFKTIRYVLRHLFKKRAK